MHEENDIIELKEQLTDEVKNEIDAFLNTKGGTIYFQENRKGFISRSFFA